MEQREEVYMIDAFIRMDGRFENIPLPPVFCNTIEDAFEYVRKTYNLDAVDFAGEEGSGTLWASNTKHNVYLSLRQIWRPE